MTNSGEPRPPPQPPVAAGSRKGKNKSQKTVDSSEASKLISARISQLELDAAGEKDQEVEIDREVKKASRELNGQMSKMSQDQRIDHLQKKCSELLADMKSLERDNIKNKKRADQLQKDKDQNRSELTKTVTIKEKMEKLARELQKESNRLKGENRTLLDEKGQNSTAWDEKYAALFQKMEAYQEEKDNPKKQVVEMEDVFKIKFKSLIDQYELRELHFHSQMRTKELEVQVNMARYEKEKKAAEAEAGRARQLNAQVQTFSKTETELRNQLNVYVDKFKQVEDTLNNSNELFLTFRKEMEDMSKKTKRLEKENESLRKRHDAMNKNILKMAEERSKHLHDLEDLRKKNTKLTSIINQMQQQGRGIPQGMATTVNNCYAGAENGGVDGDEEDEDDEEEEDEDEEDEDEDEEEDSDYYVDEDEEGEEVSEEGEYEDDTEEEIATLAAVQGNGQDVATTAKPYGPPRPPISITTGTAVATTITTAATNAAVAPTATTNGHK